MKSELIIPSRCTAKLGDDLDKEHLIGEVKLDGSRYVMYLGRGVDPYGRQPVNALLSRRVSTVDGMHVDKTANIPHILGNDHGLDYPDLTGTVLDGECFLIDFPTTQSIMGSSPAVALIKQREVGWMKYVAWDCPVFRGVDIRHKPFSERRKVLEEVVARMANGNVSVITQVPGRLAEKLFKAITNKGGEGVVVKDLRLAYGVGWAKWKRSSDISCFVSGFKPGNGKYSKQVGSIALSVFDGEIVKEVGFASGFDDETRIMITNDPASVLGRVVDISAQEFGKDSRLRHPTFHRWRDDLNQSDCTLSKLRDDMKKVRGNRQKEG